MEEMKTAIGIDQEIISGSVGLKIRIDRQRSSRHLR